jgi:hypothetical protein
MGSTDADRLAETPPPAYRYRTDESAAKRFCDTIALHQTVLSKTEILAHRFICVQLADGVSFGPYDTREAAWLDNHNRPSRLFVFPIPLERFTPQACDLLLWYVRKCYDNGWREDGRHALWIPDRQEDLRRQL